MKNETEKTEDIKEIKTQFRFNGLILPIIEHNGEDFIPIKAIVKSIGLDWRHARRVLNHEENADFHQFCDLKIADFDHKCVRTHALTACILLKTVHGYLYNIDRGAIKANGNIKSYEFLRALHEEWTQALHDYETKGVAFKNNHHANVKELLIMRKNAVGTEKQRLTFLIEQQLDEMGCPAIPEPQQTLPI